MFSKALAWSADETEGVAGIRTKTPLHFFRAKGWRFTLFCSKRLHLQHQPREVSMHINVRFRLPAVVMPLLA